MGDTAALRQAALVLVGLGPQASGALLEHLAPELVERLARAVAGLCHVAPQEGHRAVAEFDRFRRESARFTRGGEDFARQMLERALGAHRAGKLMRQVTSFPHRTRFAAVERSEPTVAANLLRHESPQTVALVLAHLDPRRAAPVLAALPAPMHAEVAYRMAVLQRPRPEVVEMLEEFLERQLEGEPGRTDPRHGGPEQVAELLNQVDNELWAGILEKMREIDEETATAVKNLMFVFEDLVTLEDRHVQDLLKEIDSRELTYALKSATDELRQKIFSNMSRRAAAGIQEDMEYVGPVRRSEVVEAQQRIIDTIRRLERDGVIVLAGTQRISDVVP